MTSHNRISLGFLVVLFSGLAQGAEWVALDAEEFERVGAEHRNFRGTEGIVFTKKDGLVRTSVTMGKAVEMEVWARVYFPWGGQEALTLKLDEKCFPVTARTATGGGRWDVGNFQVWHWVRAGRLKLDSGNHVLSLAPAAGDGQRVDRVVLYWGREPAWTQPWLAGVPVTPGVEWRRGASLVIPAADFRSLECRFESLGGARVAVLRGDADSLRTVVHARRAVRARPWARVFFEGKNMFEGLTMDEMARNLYLSIDGELRKTVYEQNARQWHWVATDEPMDLAPGPHLLTIQKQGPPVKVDRVVLYTGESPTEEDWFRSPPPPTFPFSIGDGPERLRAGHWRAHFTGRVEKMEFLGERVEPAQFPVSIVFGKEATKLDLLRVLSLDADPSEGDPTPAQQVCVWVKNPGQPLQVEVLYTDRCGEAFLQRLNDGSAWTGWRLLSANIPLRLEGGEAYFDQTGYVWDSVATPAVEAEPAARRVPGPAVRHAGGDGNGVPDFPLEVRALRLTKPAGGAAEAVFGEPFFDSPFALRARVSSFPRSAWERGARDAPRPPSRATQSVADSAFPRGAWERGEGEVAFEVEVQSSREADAVAEVRHRFGEWPIEPAEAATRLALLRCVEVAVPARGKATVSLSHKTTRPGIYFLECRAGWGEPLCRFFASGDVWKEKLAALERERERKAGAFRFSPDGQDRPLKKRDGSPLRREEVAAAYGSDRGLAVTDDGLDVCSLAYAAKRDFAYPLRPEGWDLSDEGGWPDIAIPNGILAIDPTLGRLKFAAGNPTKLSLAAALPTGFGVPGPPIAVRGHFAFVGPGEGHYSIVDVSDKTRPHVIGNINSWYFSHEMLPFRNYGYFESSHRGLILVDDLSNPYRPGPLRNVHFSRARYGRLVHVFEEAAVGYSSGGSEPALWAFDLAEPLYPREIAKVPGASSLFPAGQASGTLTLQEAQVAFTYVGETIRLLDLSDTRKPRLLPGALAREKFDKGKGLTSVFAVSSEHLALRTDKRLDLYRYSGKRGLEAEKLASLMLPEKCGRHVFGAFHRGLLYLLDGKEGPGQYSLGAKSPASRWFVFEFGNDKLQQVGLYEHPWPSAFGHITLAGDTAYVSDYNYGMWVFDVSDPRAPKRVGGAVTAGESDALWLDGARAYQWQTFGGAVFLLDISQPLSPKRLGEYWDGAWVPYGNSRRGNNTVAGKDGFLYIPRQDRGLLVVDTRDALFPPKAVGEFADEQGKPLRVHDACIDVWGDRAFVLVGKRLAVYDVSKAAAPRLVSGLEIPEADLLCAKGDKVYLGHAKGKLAIVDVADAAKPALLATLDLAPFCLEKMSEVISGIAVAKGHVYLTARGAERKGANYLHIVDVREPRQPRWVKTFDPRPDLPEAPCSVWADFDQDLIVDGDYLFIGNYGAIECYDLREPAAPRFFDRRHVGYQWSVGRKRGDFLFVPALSGLLVVRAPSSSQAPLGKLEAAAP